MIQSNIICCLLALLEANRESIFYLSVLAVFQFYRQCPQAQ